MADDYIAHIERLLARHDIATYRFVRRRRHRAVVVTRAGKEIMVVFPTSGSDWRGPRNAVATLRHKLRLLGQPEEAA